MSKTSIARSLAAAACMSVALGAGSANAIEIFALDGSGAVIGGPLPVFWTIFPTSPPPDAGPPPVPPGTTVFDNSGGFGTDWEIGVGVPNFGSAEGDSQTSAIYGAYTVISTPTLPPGVAGFRAVFTFDGFTWDSYNTTVPTNPGASDGYYDLFGVNINRGAGPYHTLVSGGGGVLDDPVVTPDPAGAPVISAGPLPGMTWAWGGLDYAAGFFEDLHGTFSVDLVAGEGDYFISAFLDTATCPDCDSGFPSWGAFNASSPVPPPEEGQSQNVPEPAALALLGLGLAGLGWLRRRKSA